MNPAITEDTAFLQELETSLAKAARARKWNTILVVGLWFFSSFLNIIGMYAGDPRTFAILLWVSLGMVMLAVNMSQFITGWDARIAYLKTRRAINAITTHLIAAQEERVKR